MGDDDSANNIHNDTEVCSVTSDAGNVFSQPSLVLRGLNAKRWKVTTGTDSSKHFVAHQFVDVRHNDLRVHRIGCVVFQTETILRESDLEV